MDRKTKKSAGGGLGGDEIPRTKVGKGETKYSAER